MAKWQPVRALSDAWEWLTLNKYDTAKDENTINVISRYGRRNVLFQNGAILDEDDQTELSTAADAAAAQLKKQVASHS
jgi:hypothetical protein